MKKETHQRRARWLAAIIVGLALPLLWWLRPSPEPPVPAAPLGGSAASIADRAAQSVAGSGPTAPVAKPPASFTGGPATSRTSPLQAIAGFDAWIAAYYGGQSDPDTGRQLARARRTALKELIALDPKAALAHAVPRSLRARLPAEIVAELETLVDAFGQFEVIAICDDAMGRLDRWAVIGGQRYQAHTYGRRLDTLSKNHLAIHGIALDDRLAIAAEPYRRLDLAELAARGESADTLSVAVGDTVKTFASPAALATWRERIVAAEAAPDPNLDGTTRTATALPSGWTVGAKTVLWIRAEFPDDPGSPATDDQIASSMAAVSTYYQDVSHGQCSFATTILPGTVPLTSTKTYYGSDPSLYLQLRTDALQLARNYDAAHGGTGTYNPDRYDRYIVIFKSVSAYTWTGIASIGTTGLCLNGTSSGCVAAHELGHNQGLHHSHAWTPTGSSPIGPGTHMEYGDGFDDMGSAQSGNTAGHFNVVQKNILGYMDAGTITTATQSGVYRIFRHDDRNASGVQAIKIATRWASTNYWLEYRRAAPYAGFAQMPRLQNGVSVHWDKGPSFTTGPGTYQLDMTPGTTSGLPLPSDYNAITHIMDDSALALNESFIDSDSGVVVTPINVGGAAPHEWIDVYVSLGANAGNRTPSLTVAAPTGLLSARSDLTFTAAGSDPDGDAVYYHWDFGDGVILPSTATVTHRWLKGGTYTVQCTALDGRGGQSTQSITVTVGDPLLTWTRRANGLTTSSLNAIIYSGGKFVAVGGYVSLVSTDGINWSQSSQGLAKLYGYGVAHNGSRYVAVGSLYDSLNQTFSCGIAASSDGVAWQDLSPAGTQTSELRAVAYAAGRFVAVGKAGAIYVSSDGLVWNTANSGVSLDLQAVQYGGGRFAAVGSNGVILSSTDGLNWQNQSIAGETGSAYSVVYYRNTWLAVTTSYQTGDSSKRAAWTSGDGLNWSKIYVSVEYSLTGLTAVANSSLLLGMSRQTNDGRIFFTEDYGSWDKVTVYTATNLGTLSAAAEGNGLIVAVGANGQIYTPSGQPFLAAQPSSQTVKYGQSLLLSAPGYATGPFSYQWYRNGVAIAGATQSTLAFSSVTTGDVGTYTAVVANAAGSVTSNAAQIAISLEGVADPGRLVSLSIRTLAGAGDQTLIVGVAIGGAGTNGTKPVLIRGIGPTLAQWNIGGVLADPKLELYAGETKLQENDNWGGTAELSAAFATTQAFPLAPDSKDAALLATPAGGAVYSVKITGQGGATGIALAEIYDATATFTATTPRLTSVSARALTGTGDNILIAGFAIGGSTGKTVLIRAIGPGLAQWIGASALADPKLELYAGQTKLQENDNWGGGAELSNAFAATYAFPLEANSKDAALLVTLPPGVYTAQVSGVGNTTGIAMIEVYEVP